jgi:predicted MPP superfamily phosphohydrolase
VNASSQSPKIKARAVVFIRDHKLGLFFLFSWLIFFVLWLIPNWSEGLFYFVFMSLMFVIIVGSQLFWISRIGKVGKKLISRKSWRTELALAGLLVYIFLLAFNLFSGINRGSSWNLRAGLLEAPFDIWFVGSVLGFFIIMLLWSADRLARVVIGTAKKVASPLRYEPQSPSRRHFLEQSAIAVSAAPFVAGTYGLFYGRLNLETTHQWIRLRHLPKAFEGFRIVQLSDLHISPFMSADEILKYIEIANQLRGDLVVVTGDFLTYDPATQGAVVRAVSALKAPFGVLGCLGNHEYITGTEESITRLLEKEQIRILRQERVAIQSGGESFNMIGIDYEQARLSADHEGHLVDRYMEKNENLVMPGTVNILLNHNPNAFDRAAELGIDLMLSGHTH